MTVRRTIFDTPLLTPLLRPMARLFLRVIGWRVDPHVPGVSQYVMVAAPHTSNFDGVLIVSMALVLGVKLFFLAKNTLFRGPFGPLLRYCGGIPVERSRSTDMVGRLAHLFSEHDPLIIVIPPEGTRSRSRRWKTGFYHLADQARVPIALGYVDYGRKVGGIGPLFEPTGDIEKDFEQIQAFYADKQPRYQHHFGDVDPSEQSS